MSRLSGEPRNLSILFGEPSGGLVDVDLDSVEARALAAEFLPETGEMFGREGSLGSHLLYVTDPVAEYRKFSDPEAPNEDRATLVEIRSGGQHTIIPPSKHPSGQIICWERRGEPARIPGEDLAKRVGTLAAAALLARHWGKEGQRHDQSLALCGGLIGGGWDAGKSAAFVRAVARAAGDEEWQERGQDAETTVERLGSGESATGWPTLAELMGEKIVERTRKWLGMAEAKDAGKKQQKPSQADLMVELAQVAHLFHDSDQEAFAVIPVENHKETHRLSTKGFKNWLKYRFFSQYGKVPGTQAVQDAAGALEGKALFAGPEHETHVRVAGHIDSVYLDLCNSEWEVVEVTPEGWRIVSGEEAMLEAYREDKDLHTMTARSITGKEEVSEEERKLAKAANFGLLYGQGAEGLRNYARNSYGVEMSLSQAERYRERFFKAYPAIRSWHRKEGKSFGSRDNAARSLTGRIRRVGRFTEKINAPVQGTAADGMKMALVLLWERRHERPGAVPILAVHDEIVVECDEGDADKAEAWLKKAMEDGMDAVVNITEPYVPIQVETSVSQAWGD